MNRSILASMLIQPAFEDPIDTEYDVLQTSMDVMIPENTALETLVNIDPRPSIKMLQKQTKLYPPQSRISQFLREG